MPPPPPPGDAELLSKTLGGGAWHHRNANPRPGYTWGLSKLDLLAARYDGNLQLSLNFCIPLPPGYCRVLWGRTWADAW